MFKGIGLFDKAKWNDPLNCLFKNGDSGLRLEGTPSGLGTYISYSGVNVDQTSMALKMSFTLKAGAIRSSVIVGGGGVSEDKELIAEYGFKIVSLAKTVWLNSEGIWRETEIYLTDKIRVFNDVTKEYKITGFPISGKLIFFLKQTLKSYETQRDKYDERIYFDEMILTIDDQDEYKDDISHEMLVDSGNNTDMEISLPISDIPNIPNNTIMYSLYFIDANGVATDMWRNKGRSDYDSLINHIIYSALNFKQLPSKRIGANMFTGKHIDMNTVVQDDKYIMTGFYVNSIELSCLTDEYKSELVEMPMLIKGDTPPDGDDCIQVCSLNFAIKTVVSTNKSIHILSSTGDVYQYDTIIRKLVFVIKTTADAKIYPSDESVTVVSDSEIFVLNNRGDIIDSYKINYNNVATYMNGYIYMLSFYDKRPPSFHRLYRLNYDYNSGGFRGDEFTLIYGDIVSLVKSQYSIVINTSERAYINDTRININEIMNVLEDGSEVKSISDYFLTTNIANSFKIFKRSDLDKTTLLKTIPGVATYACHTIGKVAFVHNDAIKVWSNDNTTIKDIKNNDGKSKQIKEIFYIGGELYIVRDGSIYKYIEDYE